MILIMGSYSGKGFKRRKVLKKIWAWVETLARF